MRPESSGGARVTSVLTSVFCHKGAGNQLAGHQSAPRSAESSCLASRT